MYRLGFQERQVLVMVDSYLFLVYSYFSLMYSYFSLVYSYLFSHDRFFVERDRLKGFLCR